MRNEHRQRGAGIRFEWGAQGLAAIGTDADAVVIVDVLSFTTTLSVALDEGISILPYPLTDADGARTLAAQRGATLAAPRSQAKTDEPTLSPASIRGLALPPARLVLPSPNGSTLAHLAANMGAICVGGCLRNTAAVADWLTDRLAPGNSTIAVVAAGEGWPDGSLRPAVEDLWGAGAIIAALLATGWAALSVEAEVAARSYDAIRGQELVCLQQCASGRELAEDGYGSDVEIAAEANSSRSVPRLVAAEFGAA